MGNSSATLVVFLQGQEVVTGFETFGKVYLDVPNNYELQVATVNVRIFGIERTEVSYLDAVLIGKESRTSVRTASGKSTFLDVDFVVARFSGDRICHGQHEFPFSFVLPRGSPSSMTASPGFQDKCNVAYVVEAQLKDPTGAVMLKAKRTIAVVNKLQEMAPVPVYLEPDKVSIVTCCCMHRGEVMLTASTVTTTLCPSEEVTVKFAVLNNSLVPIDAVEVSLKEYVTFKAGNYTGKGLTTALYTKKVSPSRDMNFGQVRSSSAQGDEAADLRALHDALTLGTCAVRFQLPVTTRNTLLGRLINVKHVLTVRALTAAGSIHPTVSMDIPVHTHIVDAGSVEAVNSPANNVYVAVPAGWKPVIAPLSKLPPISISTEILGTSKKATVPLQSNPTATFKDKESEGTQGSAEGSFEALIEQMRESFTPCFDVDRWVHAEGRSLRALSAAQIVALFSATSGGVNQVQLAGMLAEARVAVSCQLLQSVASVCGAAHRRDVVEKLLTAGPLADKAEHAPALMAQFTPFQALTLEKYVK